MIEIDIPGYKKFRFKHLVLDVNGTIAKDGQLLKGVAELLKELGSMLIVHLITADTHGNQEIIDAALSLKAVRISPGNQAMAKLHHVEALGAEGVVAIGNGANDSAMLEKAGLGIFVLGPEGSAVEALMQSDVIAPDICSALELLTHPKRLMATLRR
jgi:soluble P-type ATPase